MFVRITIDFMYEIYLINLQREESKSNIGKAGFGSRKLMHDPRMRNKRKPPRGMHLSVESIKSVAKGPFTQRHSVLKKLDLGFVNLRRQVVTASPKLILISHAKVEFSPGPAK